MALGLGFEGLGAGGWEPSHYTQRVLSTNIGNTYPNHNGSYYYRNHTLYHISTLDPLG